MFNQIEDAIATRIKTKLSAAAGHVAVQKGTDGIAQPAVYVSAEDGKFEKEGQITLRQHVTVFIDIIFEHLGDEQQRRHGIFMILEGIVQTLWLQKLGLEIKPIKPKSWRNTTTEEFREKGLIIFSLEVETSFTIEPLDEEVVTDLMTVGMTYYLQDPANATQDSADTVNLPELPKQG